MGDGPEAKRRLHSATVKWARRTGPALNPLKGSSARLSHCLLVCTPQAKPNCFISSPLSLGLLVKMFHPPRKFTCQEVPPYPLTGFTLYLGHELVPVMFRA